MAINRMGQAPAHAFQSTIALPKASREVKRGISLADLGIHLQPASVGQRKIDGFPCRSTRTQPEVGHEGPPCGSLHVPMNDRVPACRQT